MAKYALFIGNAVANVCSDPENEFHPDIATSFEEVADDVEVGFQRNEDGTVTAPPVVELSEVEVTTPARVLTRLEFLRLFTREERVKLAEARPNDAIVNDFFMMLDLATEVSFDDPDITDGVGYLATKGYLTGPRASEILGA